MKFHCCAIEMVIMCGDDKFNCRQFTFLSKFKMCRLFERLWIQRKKKNEYQNGCVEPSTVRKIDYVFIQNLLFMLLRWL